MWAPYEASGEGGDQAGFFLPAAQGPGRKPAQVLSVREVLRGRALRQAREAGECSQMGRQREGHWAEEQQRRQHRGWRFREVEARGHCLWIDGGFLVGLELQFGGGWKGKSWPHGA